MSIFSEDVEGKNLLKLKARNFFNRQKEITCELRPDIFDNEETSGEEVFLRR